MEKTVKVEPNTLLRKDHLYQLFKNTAYLSSRVVAGANSSDPAVESQMNEARLNQILNEVSLPSQLDEAAFKVVGFSDFCNFPTYRPCRCIAESNDASVLAAGGAAGALHVIPTVEADGDTLKRKPNGHSTTKVQGHNESVEAVDFHPRRTIIASGGADCNILVHDINVANGFIHSVSEIQKINDSSPIRCLRFHPCGDFLYAGTGNSIIRLFDLTTKACFTSSQTRRQHQGGGINGCDVLHSGGLVFTAGGDGSVIIWDGKTLDVLNALEDIHGGSPVLCVRCDKYGRYLLSSGHDGSTKVVDIRMMKELISLARPGLNAVRTASDFMYNSGYIATLAVTQSGRKINNDVMVYNMHTGYKEAELSSLVARQNILNIYASRSEMALYILTADATCKVVSFFDPSS